MRWVTITSTPSGELASLWNECLDNCEFASHYASPQFFLEPYFKDSSTFAILAQRADGRVEGALTGTRQGHQILCGHISSPQLCIRRDASHSAVIATLAEGIGQLASRNDELISVYSWSKADDFPAAGFRERKFGAPSGGAVLIDLTRGPDRLLKESSETRRNQVRRAIRNQVEVTEMIVERDFDGYYELYRHWCDFKSLPIVPYEVQRSAFEMRGNRLALVARHQGNIVGVSTFRYRLPGIIEYAGNVSRRDATKLRQNDLLLWKGIEWACAQRGLRWFSCAGVHLFLQLSGGDVVPVLRYRRDRTLLRRHDLKDACVEIGRRIYKALPSTLQSRVKTVVARGESS
jgi:hypothetical protein